VDATSELTAKCEPFDSFWEGPEEVEKGYRSFYQFYRCNYLHHMPAEKDVRVLVISCGPGYFVDMLIRQGYTDVLGIDSDADKVRHGLNRGLPLKTVRAFPFLDKEKTPFDVIFCEQELNHLTKEEIAYFLRLCWSRLKPGGTFIAHVLNGANPITGAEALAQNIDHYNTFTEYSLRQALKAGGFEAIRVIPLKLYVFYKNPLNYVAMAIAGLYTLFFRFSFKLYGKSNRLFTKKIAGICRRP